MGIFTVKLYGNVSCIVQSQRQVADAVFLCYALNMEQLLNYKRTQNRLLAHLWNKVNELTYKMVGRFFHNISTQNLLLHLRLQNRNFVIPSEA